MITFTNGKHAYRGTLNCRAQRQRSKIFKGLNINVVEVNNSFKLLDNENRQKQISKNRKQFKQNSKRETTCSK